MVHLSNVFIFRVIPSQPESHLHKALAAKRNSIYVDIRITSSPKTNEEARELCLADIAFCRVNKAPRFRVDFR
jgi:hypothetical protein